MAENELQGVIKLTADDTEAKKTVDALDTGAAGKVAGPAAKSLEDIATKLRAIFRDLGTLGGGVFGGVAHAIDDTAARVQKSFGGKNGISGIFAAGLKETLDSAIKSGMSLPARGTFLPTFQQASFAPGGAGVQPTPTGFAGVMNSLGMVNRAGGGSFQLPPWMAGLFGRGAAGGGGGIAGVAGAAGGAAGGGGGGGAAVAGGVAAAGGGAAGVAASLGPLGIAIAAVGASLAIYAGLAMALKEVTTRVIDFGRSLASASPSMARLFAVFDVQVMLMKRQIGEALAPAFAQLLQSLLNLSVKVLPAFTSAMEVIITLLTAVIQQIEEWVMQTKAEFGVGKGLVQMGAGFPFEGISSIASAVKEYFSWRRQQENKPLATPNVMQDYMNMLNAQGSAQRMYQQQQSGAPPAPLAPPPAPPRGMRISPSGMKAVP